MPFETGDLAGDLSLFLSSGLKILVSCLSLERGRRNLVFMITLWK